jgi:hypothetical protein
MSLPLGSMPVAYSTKWSSYEIQIDIGSVKNCEITASAWDLETADPSPSVLFQNIGQSYPSC